MLTTIPAFRAALGLVAGALWLSAAPAQAQPSPAYDVGADGAVLLRNAPYPRNSRYGSSPTPPRMRMPAPVVLNAPGVVQAPVWTMGRSGRADDRTPSDEREFPPDGECRWYLQPRRAGMATPQDAARQGITAAEMAALRADMEPVLAWLSSRPALDRPVGVCALFANYGLYASPGVPVMIDSGHALRGRAVLGFWPGAQLRRRADRIVADGEIAHLIFDFNVLPGGESSRYAIEDAAGPMFEEVPVTHTLNGLPVYANSDLYIPRSDRPLTRPVRTERLLRWQMGAIDADLSIRRRDAARAAEELAALQTPEQRARDERTILLRAQASFGGNVERARASFEGDRTADAARLRAAANVDDPAHPVQELLRMRAASERLLSTPLEAAAPGCLTPAVAGTTVPDVVGTDHPHCVRRMEEPNPDHYDRALPRSRVQLVRVRRFDLRRSTDDRAAAANFNLVTGVDWRAFRDEVLRR